MIFFIETNEWCSGRDKRIESILKITNTEMRIVFKGTRLGRSASRNASRSASRSESRSESRRPKVFIVTQRFFSIFLSFFAYMAFNNANKILLTNF